MGAVLVAALASTWTVLATVLAWERSAAKRSPHRPWPTITWVDRSDDKHEVSDVRSAL